MRKLELICGKAKINGEYVTEAIIEVADDKSSDYLASGAWKDITDILAKDKAKKEAKKEV
jgi:hypothetical protein